MEAFLNKALNEIITNPLYSTVQKDIFKKQTLYLKATNQIIIFELKKNSKTYSYMSLSLGKKAIEKHFNISFISEAGKVLLMPIHSLIIHPGNNNQLCILLDNCFAFIQDLTNFTEKSNQITVKHIFNESPVIQIKFSYFNNVFGVLLSNNTFRIYSIDSCQPLAEITNFTPESPIVDFTFCSKSKTNPYWEAFMVYFIGENGQISITGPFFPKEFIINSIDFISLKSRLYYLNELSYQLYSALEKCIIPNKDSNEKSTDYYFISNYQLENWNKHLSARPLAIQNDYLTDYDREMKDVKYLQLELISSDPYVFLFRVTTGNQIEVIALFEATVPIRDWYNLVKDNDFNKPKNGNYLVEVIHLKKNVDNIANANYMSKPIYIFSKTKEKILIEVNGDVYSIEFPYLLSMLDNTNRGELSTVYNSITKMIVNSYYDNSLSKTDNKSQNKPQISKNYFLIELIQNEVVFVRSVDNKLVCKALPSSNQSKKIEAKALQFPHSKTQVSSFPSIDLINNGNNKEKIKEEIELVNQFQFNNISIDLKSKIVQKAMRTYAFQGLINDQADSLAKCYENMFASQFNMLKLHTKGMTQEIDLIEKSEIKSSYSTILTAMKSIENEKKVIQNQSEEIKMLLEKIKTRVNNLKQKSPNMIKTIAMVNTFQKEKEKELKELSSLMALNDKQIKDISITKELSFELKFNDDLLSSEAKEQTNDFLSHIKSIQEIVRKCLNEVKKR